MQQNTKNSLVVGLKIIAAAGLVSSSIIVYHYETSVKETYQPGTESFSDAAESIETYLLANGCSDRATLSKHTNLSYLEVAQVTHGMSLTGTLGDYPAGICLSYQADRLQ